MNRKGVVEIAVILYAVIAFLGGVILWKPVTNLLGISNEAKKHQESKVMKKESRPVLVYTDDKGKEHIAMATKEEQSNFEMTEQPKQTFWQKIKNLGVWGIFLVILGFLFPPVGAFLMMLWNKAKSAVVSAENKIEEIRIAHETLSGDATLIVRSIDEGLAQFDSAISAAKVSLDVANQAAVMSASIIDPISRAATLDNAQHTQAVAQAVINSVTQLKKDFLSAMSRKQDSTTKLLVAQLKND